jgi:hypothetical protein
VLLTTRAGAHPGGWVPYIIRTVSMRVPTTVVKLINVTIADISTLKVRDVV